VNVDEPPDVVPDQGALLAVDEDAYFRYVAEYIKFPGSPDLPAWQIFSEFVMRDLHWYPDSSATHIRRRKQR